MGDTFHNRQRPYQLTAVPAFVRIIDRPDNGTNANTYSFEYAGAATRQIISKADDSALVDSAATSQAAFASTASSVLADWSSMSPGQRSDAWQLYRLTAVKRWAEVHQELNPGKIHIRNPDITAAQDAELSAAAKLGRSDFDAKALSVFAPAWWSQVTPVDKTGFFANYKEA